MIDLSHPLAVLARRMPWGELEKTLAPVFAHRDRQGRVTQQPGLFGPSLEVAGAGVSNAGRPRLPIRLMVSLLYLKHAFNLSDEALVERWSENVLWRNTSAGASTTSTGRRAMPRRSGAFARRWGKRVWKSC